jgi:hypothetical protein
MNVDVALLDRLDVLGSTADDGPRRYQRLSLYDLASNRTVLVAEVTTGTVGARRIPVLVHRGQGTQQWWVLDRRQLR